MNKHVDVLTIGSVLQDITLETHQGVVLDTPQDVLAKKKLAFELGAKISVEKAMISVGGGAANTAATFVKLGIHPAISSRIGADEQGKRIRSYLKEAGVDVGLLQEDQHHQTGLSLLLIKLPESEHVAFPYRGANEEFVAPSVEDFKGVAPRWVYMSSLQGPHWKQEVGQIIGYARKPQGKVKLAWNPGSAQIALPPEELRQLTQSVEVLIVNKDEATEIISHKIRHERNFSMTMLLSHLVSFGSRWVIITDGAQGAFLTNGVQRYHALALKTHVVDTTGAGDAFGASVVAGLMITGGDMKEALKYGIVNSAAAVSEVGSQFGLLGREELQKRLKRVIVKTL